MKVQSGLYEFRGMGHLAWYFWMTQIGTVRNHERSVVAEAHIGDLCLVLEDWDRRKMRTLRIKCLVDGITCHTSPAENFIKAWSRVL